MGTELLLFAAPRGPLHQACARWCHEQSVLFRAVERHAPDLMALPFALAVVDRAYLGWGAWQDFRDYRLETGDMKGCVVLVDGHGWPDISGGVLVSGPSMMLLAALEYGLKEASC